jgi:FtsP/CotA-like multicopper oxidase with cupredoxin domain
MQQLSRRQLLASTVAAGAIGAGASLPLLGRSTLAAPAAPIQARTGVIEVNGRPATVFGLMRPDGSHGLVAEAGEHFRVRLENQLTEDTLIHWHGLTPPWQQDDVPGLSQAPIGPGGSYDYDFPLERPGTNWIHSHHGLQEQRLMAAPLIVRDPAESGADMQEVVVLFHDFTFRVANEILTDLQGGPGAAGHGPGHGPGPRRMMDAAMPAPAMDHGGGHAGMDHAVMSHGAMGAGRAHLHDVDYEAFLANDRTLGDPEVFRVEHGGRVRLRLINAATATNFCIDLDTLEGRLIAVDGMQVEPLTGRRFPFAIARRLDILLELPPSEGACPIFAVREGEPARTGFVLATRRGSLSKLPGEAGEPAAPVDLALERRLRALPACRTAGPTGRAASSSPRRPVTSACSTARCTAHMRRWRSGMASGSRSPSSTGPAWRIRCICMAITSRWWRSTASDSAAPCATPSSFRRTAA